MTLPDGYETMTDAELVAALEAMGDTHEEARATVSLLRHPLESTPPPT